MYHKMTFEIDNEMLQSYNDRRFKKGDIVFFIRNNQGAIDWGEVETVFCDRNVLTLYELRDERTVEGIPIKDYNFNPEKSDWRKLPEGFLKKYDMPPFRSWVEGEDLEAYEEERTKYCTEWSRCNFEKHKELFEMGAKYLEGEEEWRKKPLYDVDVIREGIDKGFYVLPSTQRRDLSAQSEITTKGWRIVPYRLMINHAKDCYVPTVKRCSDYVSVPFYQTYATYAEADYFIKQYRAELERQSNLTDYEFDMEHLERVLKLCYLNTDDEKDIIRKVIGKMFKDDKDIDMKNSTGRFLWRKSGMKKWTEVVGDEI